MDQEYFYYLLSNQAKWSEQFKEQKINNRQEHNKEVIKTQWYGNSKEYHKTWRQQGAQTNK
jgi:hypothetical protein